MKNSSGMTMKGAFYALVFGACWMAGVGYGMRQIGVFGAMLALFGAVFVGLGANGLYQGRKNGEKLELFKKVQQEPPQEPKVVFEEIEMPQKCPYCQMNIGGVYSICPRCGKRTNLREVQK